MQHEALSERIGALETGLEPGQPLDEAGLRWLREVMRERKLLLFRFPDLPVDEQIRLVGCFARVWDEKGDGARHIFVSNNRQGAVLARPDGLLFHSDCVFLAAPLAVLSLYALEVPCSPSPTVFANAIEAARELPAAVLGRLEGARGRFVGGAGGYQRLRSGTAPDIAVQVEHELQYPDRLAGEPTLLVDEMYFDEVVGWDAEDSEELRREVHRHLFADRNCYSHHWQVGDLVIWDNLALQHGRTPVPDDGPRTLRRVVGLDPAVEEYEHLTLRHLQIEAARRDGGAAG